VIVVDASAVMEVVLRSSAAATIERRVHDMRETLQAPCRIDIEVAHVVRRAVLRREIDDERGRLAIDVLIDSPVNRHSHIPLLPLRPSGAYRTAVRSAPPMEKPGCAARAAGA
jgi:predicted nucleic acid-binding protein